MQRVVVGLIIWITFGLILFCHRKWSQPVIPRSEQLPPPLPADLPAQYGVAPTSPRQKLNESATSKNPVAVAAQLLAEGKARAQLYHSGECLQLRNSAASLLWRGTTQEHQDDGPRAGNPVIGLRIQSRRLNPSLRGRAKKMQISCCRMYSTRKLGPAQCSDMQPRYSASTPPDITVRECAMVVAAGETVVRNMGVSDCEHK